MERVLAVEVTSTSPEVEVMAVPPAMSTSDEDVVRAIAISAGTSSPIIPAQPSFDKSVRISDDDSTVTVPPLVIALSWIFIVDDAVRASYCTSTPAPVSGLS